MREDLIWGVRNSQEVDYHIIQSHFLARVYRVGVVTATSAYVIRPSFFDAALYRDFADAPDDIRHVDDIWLSGQASKRKVARLIVPSCCSHTGVTRHHSLQSYLGRNNMTRSSANHHALGWFRKHWEKDLWYQFNGVNQPTSRSWCATVYREWIGVTQWIRFVLRFGFVYI